MALVLAGALAGCGGSTSATESADPYPGTSFEGDGYAIRIPSDPELDFSRDAGVDTWLGTNADGTPAGITVQVLRNLLGVEQSLEGALGRLRSGFETAGGRVIDEDVVALPAGGAYRVTSDLAGAPVVAFAFYRDGVAVLVTTIGLPEGLADDLAQTVAFSP